MSDTKTFTEWMECDGDCGARIELTARRKTDLALDAAAEALGWTTRGPFKGKGTQQVYCPFCQERAKRIVEG